MADRILAVCTVLLAGIYLYATSTLPSFDFGDPLGPRAFPVLLGILLAAAGVLLLLETRNRRSAILQSASRPDAPPVESRPRAVVTVALATMVFFGLLEPLGYLVGFTLYLFLVMLWLHGRKPVTCFAIAALFAVGSYALFVKGLAVSLPKGLLHF